MAKEAFFDPKLRGTSRGVTPREWQQLSALADKVTRLEILLDRQAKQVEHLNTAMVAILKELGHG